VRMRSRLGGRGRFLRAGARQLTDGWHDLETFLGQVSPSAIRRKQASSTLYRPSDAELTRIQSILVRILTENIVPFWYPSTVDTEDGGYRANHDLQGRWKGPANKSIVSQARNLWFYSRLARSQYGTHEHLRAASHGHEFLRGSMWDAEFGGFYWEVDPTGRRPTQSFKHVYGQAMALYALSEYAVASGDTSAITLSDQLFRNLEDHAHDPEYGGYHEFFQRDWGPPSPEDANPLGRHIAPNMKTTNAHVHLLESITRYCGLSEDSVARQRLIELILVMTSATVHKKLGACRQLFLDNWAPLRGAGHNRVSYGHDVEGIWLLMEALKVANQPNPLLLDLYRTVFGYAVRYGFDRRAGGFYTEGRPRRAADRREKVWWVQAEALLSALHMYVLTRERTYFECFRQTLGWISARQVDWENKEWFAEVDGGTARGNKAGAWKDPYHNGRAMIECLALLEGRKW